MYFCIFKLQLTFISIYIILNTFSHTSILNFIWIHFRSKHLLFVFMQYKDIISIQIISPSGKCTFSTPQKRLRLLFTPLQVHSNFLLLWMIEDIQNIICCTKCASTGWQSFLFLSSCSTFNFVLPKTKNRPKCTFKSPIRLVIPSLLCHNSWHHGGL